VSRCKILENNRGGCSEHSRLAVDVTWGAKFPIMEKGRWTPGFPKLVRKWANVSKNQCLYVYCAPVLPRRTAHHQCRPQRTSKHIQSASTSPPRSWGAKPIPRKSCFGTPGLVTDRKNEEGMGETGMQLSSRYPENLVSVLPGW
jgi:hypothetical protein